eukprot:359188-Chlamydomonas_euryale.AAC.17
MEEMPVLQNYYDNRYWTMWKLPMFGCTDAAQVLKEVALCTQAFPNAYVRLVAFDNSKQVQCMGFLVQRPANAKEYCPVQRRSACTRLSLQENAGGIGSGCPGLCNDRLGVSIESEDQDLC